VEHLYSKYWEAEVGEWESHKFKASWRRERKGKTKKGGGVGWGEGRPATVIVCETPFPKNNPSKMDWRYGSSSRAPVLQA
jgi:hypothetical protein